MNAHLIAACATAPGAGGVSVIRLSGQDAALTLDPVVSSRVKPSQRPANSFFYTTILDGDTPIDDAIVLIFKAPHSYTGEDVVEVQCHGGTVSAERILKLLYRHGAQPAEPGEFTKRAFLNGRIDLTQAEAVCDIIQARTERAAKAAHDQLAGRLSRTLAPLYQSLLTLSAQVENLLDFDEGELPVRFEEQAHDQIATLNQSLTQLLATWHQGRLMRDGALVVIAGKPNAGKSSLLNLLLGYNRAIVNAAAGTTRDSIEERLDLDGVPIRLVDTAGLRQTACAIEHEGVDRAHAMIGQADVVIYLKSHTAPIDPEEETFIQTLPPERTIHLINKSDQEQTVTHISIREHPDHAKESVCQALRDQLQLSTTEPVAQVVDQRHYSELTLAQQELQAATAQFTAGPIGYVPAAEHLRSATQALARILGKAYTHDLLDRIFSTFCVGK